MTRTNDRKSFLLSDDSSSLESTPSVIDLLSPRLSASSWPEDIEDEDSGTVYSYFSTWSSNYTSSNLVGPGRLIGNFYSRAGLFLEKKFERLINRVEMKADEIAASILLRSGVGPGTVYDMMWGGDAEEVEMACDVLLRCAKSSDPDIQIVAFRRIVKYSIFFPSTFRIILEGSVRNRGEFIDIVTSLWRQRSVEYGSSWLYHYRLALRCLSTHAGPVIDVAARLQLDRAAFRGLDFSAFEGVISACRDITDLVPSLHFIYEYWDGKGIAAYVQRKGFDDEILLDLAETFITRKLTFSRFIAQTDSEHAHLPSWDASRFISGVWSALQDVGESDSYEVSDVISRMEIWAKVFELHYILYRRFERARPLVLKKFLWMDGEDVDGTVL